MRRLRSAIAAMVVFTATASAHHEDPDYLAEPLTVSTEWDYAPRLPLLRFGCDRAQTRRYLFR